VMGFWRSGFAHINWFSNILPRGSCLTYGVKPVWAGSTALGAGGDYPRCRSPENPGR
jgi:hypothetical protein